MRVRNESQRITEQEATANKGFKVVITDLNTGEELVNQTTKIIIGAMDYEDIGTRGIGYCVGEANKTAQVALAAVTAATNIVEQINKETTKMHEEDKPCSLDELKEDVLKDALKAILEGNL